MSTPRGTISRWRVAWRPLTPPCRCCCLGLCFLSFPLPPSICTSDDFPPLILVLLLRKLCPSPLFFTSSSAFQLWVPCFRVWIVKFVIQFDDELFDRMTETHAWPTNDSRRGTPRREEHSWQAVHVHANNVARPPKTTALQVVFHSLQAELMEELRGTDAMTTNLRHTHSTHSSDTRVMKRLEFLVLRFQQKPSLTSV